MSELASDFTYFSECTFCNSPILLELQPPMSCSLQPQGIGSRCSICPTHYVHPSLVSDHRTLCSSKPSPRSQAIVAHHPLQTKPFIYALSSTHQYLSLSNSHTRVFMLVFYFTEQRACQHSLAGLWRQTRIHGVLKNRFFDPCSAVGWEQPSQFLLQDISRA